jgi:hypothetical protein
MKPLELQGKIRDILWAFRHQLSADQIDSLDTACLVLGDVEDRVQLEDRNWRVRGFGRALEGVKA